jgi:DNA-binding NtrC family response regulator
MARIIVLEDFKPAWKTTYKNIAIDSMHDIDLFADVASAIDAFDSQKYDLVISDLDIKGNDLQGIDFLVHIRKKNQDIPILIVTGVEYVSFHTRKDGTFYEGIKISKQIKKPVRSAKLLSIINETLARQS